MKITPCEPKPKKCFFPYISMNTDGKYIIVIDSLRWMFLNREDDSTLENRKDPIITVNAGMTSSYFKKVSGGILLEND